MLKTILATLFLTASALFAEIYVACAANMQFAMKDIVEAYQKQTQHSVKLVFGSSGKMTAQILHGAPFHIFISADMAYGDSLYRKGYATASPKEYARGALVLWSTRSIDLKHGLAAILDPKVKSIAMGDPKVTIYGPAAMEVLEKSGLLAQAKPKLVFGDNITTVAQFIVNGSVDIGFASLSFTQSGPMAGKGTYISIDPKLYSPLSQGASILRHALENNPNEVDDFFSFLFSPTSRAILVKHGYEVP